MLRDHAKQSNAFDQSLEETNRAAQFKLMRGADLLSRLSAIQLFVKPTCKFTARRKPLINSLLA